MPNKKKILKDEEKAYIIENYNKTSVNFMSKQLNINAYLIKTFMKENNLISGKVKKARRSDGYTLEEENFIKENYLSMSYKELGSVLNKTEAAIRTKVHNMDLELKVKKWSENELKILKEVFPNYINSYISKNFLPNRSPDCIQVKAGELGYKKESCRWFNKEILKEMLINYSNKIGRTPTAGELVGNDELPSAITYTRYFGSYQAACIECGLPTNVCLFGEYSSSLLAKDNKTICLSSGELIISNFLIDNNINFEKEKYYTDIFGADYGYKRCDWYLTDFDVIVEYFGLSNKDYYKIKMDEKINICKDNNKELVFITRERPTQKFLTEKFKQFI